GRVAESRRRVNICYTLRHGTCRALACSPAGLASRRRRALEGGAWASRRLDPLLGSLLPHADRGPRFVGLALRPGDRDRPLGRGGRGRQRPPGLSGRAGVGPGLGAPRPQPLRAALDRRRPGTRGRSRPPPGPSRSRPETRALPVAIRPRGRRGGARGAAAGGGLARGEDGDPPRPLSGLGLGRRMRLRTGWGVLLLWLGASCAASPNTFVARHEAVRKTYPPERYVVGVGEGPTLELARRKAAVEISAQLQGSLRAEGWVEAESDRIDGVERARESVREEIRVETGLARMEWIEVVSARTRGDAVEVFAVLDRRRAAESLRAEIEDRLAGLDAQIARWEETRGILAPAQGLMGMDEGRRIGLFSPEFL